MRGPLSLRRTVGVLWPKALLAQRRGPPAFSLGLLGLLGLSSLPAAITHSWLLRLRASEIRSAGTRLQDPGSRPGFQPTPFLFRDYESTNYKSNPTHSNGAGDGIQDTSKG